MTFKEWLKHNNYWAGDLPLTEWFGAKAIGELYLQYLEEGYDSE